MAARHWADRQHKAQLVGAASRELPDLGTTLNSGSTRLATTDRPAVYREFLRRGGTHRCVLLGPAGEGAARFKERHAASTSTKRPGSPT
ncbi:hypothetical protein ACGFMK_19955 [Amycolatopsis sp. NPDC049252]|uniref:hypothetical protein n=1 Tax=Amycolatopsis sp. NPDC049252 TaxID=3363933 RepID=UPI0037108947